MSCIGERIKEIRKLRGITQKDLSEMVYVTQSYISRIELNKETPTDMLLKLIALDFNVSLDWLRTGNGSMKIDDKHDYFERNNKKNLITDITTELTQFSNILIGADAPSINANTIGIIQYLKDFLENHNEDQSFAILVYEQITNIAMAVCEVVQELDEKDFSTSTAPNIYKLLRMTSNENYDALMIIGELYEQKYTRKS